MTEPRKLSPLSAPLVEITRGPLVESQHRGHVVAMDTHEKIIASVGDAQVVVYLRSCAKPFHAVSIVASGAADHFGFTEQEIALIAGSHNGEPTQTATAMAMLKKIGADENALKCGVTEPLDPETARQLIEQHQQPTPIHNTCSGNHAGLLALAKWMQAPLDSYTRLEHPVQQLALHTIATFADTAEQAIVIGNDGCGIPTFGLPLHAVARMFARLMSPPTQLSENLRNACQRVVKAMMSCPSMICGSDCFDTALIQAAPDRLISKEGAAGMYTVGVLPNGVQTGTALAVMIEDGDKTKRAGPAVMVSALEQLKLLNAAELAQLKSYANPEEKNHPGEKVGELRARFSLFGHSQS